ncbi:MAG: CHAD domain-containing protein, partial [Streptomycetaceae bacterium]|nr:CHAD domain-containing protein [Streptomycetaceae bacterium]
MRDARLPRPRMDPDEAPDGSGPPEPAAAGDPTSEPGTSKPGKSKPGRDKPGKNKPAKGKSAKSGKAEKQSASPEPATARTAGDVLLDHLAGEAAEFLRQAPRVREGGEDSAHQMRVAARRMRSALRTCASLVLPESADTLTVELRWAADCLAGERDNEVLLERLLAALDGMPVRSGT